MRAVALGEVSSDDDNDDEEGAPEAAEEMEEEDEGQLSPHGYAKSSKLKGEDQQEQASPTLTPYSSLPPLERALLAAQLAVNSGRSPPNAAASEYAARASSGVSGMLSAASGALASRGERGLSMSGVWARSVKERLEARLRSKEGSSEPLNQEE